jgi:chromosome segregation ATPase
VGRAAGAARGQAAGLGKIAKLVDQMLDILGREQEEDDSKRESCTADLQREEARSAQLREEIASAGAELNSTRSEVQAADGDIEALRGEVQELDVSVQLATKNRQAANSASVRKLTEINEALDVFKEAENILLNVGGAYAKAKSMSGIQEEASADIAALLAANQSQVARSSTWDLADAADSAMRGAAAGGGGNAAALLAQVAFDAVEMIRKIQEDLEADFSQCQLDEKQDQEEYEQLMQASKRKRAKDVQAITKKSSGRADLQATLHRLQTRIHGCQVELDQTSVVVASLHQDCDELLKGYEEQRKARDTQRGALRKTQAVLQSADASPSAQ